MKHTHEFRIVPLPNLDSSKNYQAYCIFCLRLIWINGYTAFDSIEELDNEE